MEGTGTFRSETMNTENHFRTVMAELAREDNDYRATQRSRKPSSKLRGYNLIPQKRTNSTLQAC